MRSAALRVEDTVMLSALIVMFPAETAPEITTSSIPSSPFTVRSTPATSKELIVSTSLLTTGRPASPPRLIVRLLVGSLKVMLSKVKNGDAGASVSVLSPLSVSVARSSRLLVVKTRSAASMLSEIGSRPS